MEIEISRLKPNPFKRQINSGKLNREQINKIKASLKDLGFMGSFSVTQEGNSYSLNFGHHRQQAVIEKFGKNYKVNITIQNYNEDQKLRAMVIENVTQRGVEFQEKAENLVVIRNYLKKSNYVRNPNKIKITKNNPKGAGRNDESGSIRAVAEWLNRNGEIMPNTTIHELLNTKDFLAPDLFQEAQLTHKGKVEGRRGGEVLSKTQAIYLASIKSMKKDKPKEIDMEETYKEQRDIAKALKKSRDRLDVRRQSHLISEYKKAKPEVKKMVRNGDMDLADVETRGVNRTPRLEKSKVDKILELKTNMMNVSNTIQKYFDDDFIDELTNKQRVDIMFSMQLFLGSTIKDFFVRLSQKKMDEEELKEIMFEKVGDDEEFDDGR